MSRFHFLFNFILVISISFICFRAVFVSVDDYSQLRNFKFGDSISDKMTISSSRYFFDHGFLSTHFRPVHLYPDNQPQVYTHYGAFPDVLTGAFAILIGSTSESKLRLLPIIISILTMILFYQLLLLFAVKKNDALLMVAIVSLSNWFLMWADALNKHVYEFFLLVMSLNISFLVIKRRQFYFGSMLAFLIGLISIHISYELVIYLAVFYFSLIVFNRLFSRFYILLLTALYLGFVVGFVLHLYLNYLVFQDFQLMMNDLLRAMHVRGSIHFLGRIDAVVLYFQRINIYFYFDWTLLFLSFYFFKKQLKELHLKNIFYSLSLASIGWPLLMPQHVIVHEFTTRWLFLLVVFCTIYFVFPWIKNFKSKFHHFDTSKKIVVISYVLFLFILFVQNQWLMTIVRNLKVVTNG